MWGKTWSLIDLLTHAKNTGRHMENYKQRWIKSKYLRPFKQYSPWGGKALRGIAWPKISLGSPSTKDIHFVRPTLSQSKLTAGKNPSAQSFEATKHLWFFNKKVSKKNWQTKCAKASLYQVMPQTSENTKNANEDSEAILCWYILKTFLCHTPQKKGTKRSST